jgi:hypothetical protein
LLATAWALRDTEARTAGNRPGQARSCDGVFLGLTPTLVSYMFKNANQSPFLSPLNLSVPIALRRFLHVSVPKRI